MQCTLTALLALCLLAQLAVSREYCHNASNIDYSEGRITLELAGVLGPQGPRGEKGVKGSIGLSGLKGGKGQKGVKRYTRCTGTYRWCRSAWFNWPERSSWARGARR